jgi:hypothetical protein
LLDQAACLGRILVTVIVGNDGVRAFEGIGDGTALPMPESPPVIRATFPMSLSAGL